MKIAIISLNGKSSKMIAEECKSYFSKVDLLNLKDFEVQVNGVVKVANCQKDLEKYDCIYIRGSYKYALLQRSITRALNHDVYLPIKPNAFTLGHDKFLTLLELQKNGIAIPRTHFAATTRIAKKILDKVDIPVIMKVSEGTHGRGVMIAESKKSAYTILDLLEDFNKPYLIQEFVKTKDTSDLRVVVFKEKVLAVYKRVASEGEIRANIHAGGTRETHELTPEEKRLAIESAKAIGADLCGVDILNAENPSVIEINLSPGVSSLSEVCDGNIPGLIARELYENTKKFKKRKKEKEKKKLKRVEKKVD
jgi:ribosomal protein S6--L-glutamate ligase